jgi:outer membrane protein TolC
MNIPPTRLALLSAIALAGQWLAGPVLAESWALRPSLVQTSYIHVVPGEAFSGDFAAVIREGVQKSGAVQAAAARWHAEEYGIEAAAGAQLPSAVVFGEAGLASGTTQTPYAYGVRVSVPVYDGFSAGHATQAQSSLASAARFAAMDELAATLVDLVAAGAAIRRAQDTYKIRQTQYAAMRDLLASIASEREAGTASKVDTDQVEAQLLQIDSELKAAAVARIEANESFARIAGEAPSHISAIGSIAAFLPRDQSQAIEIALAENPQLGQRLHQADAAHATTKSMEAGFGPDLNFDLSFGGSGDWNQQSTARIDARAVFRLELPLAFGTSAAVQKKVLEAQASDFEVAAARAGVTAGISAAYERLLTTRSGLYLAYDALQRSKSVAGGMQTEYELGDRSVFDLMAAQNAVTEAQLQVTELQYKLTVAEHLLAAQVGRIDDIYAISLK